MEFLVTLPHNPQPPAQPKADMAMDICINTRDLRGYFERHDGCCSGGLWFDRVGAPVIDKPLGGLKLTDYDGVGVLSARVIRALREAGCIVTKDFDFS